MKLDYDCNKLIEVLNEVKAAGGRDTPEDLKGALRIALDSEDFWGNVKPV